MRCTISQIYFGIELYMFRTGLLSIIRSFNTVHTAIGICHKGYADCLQAPSRWNSKIIQFCEILHLVGVFFLIKDSTEMTCCLTFLGLSPLVQMTIQILAKKKNQEMCKES